MVSDTLNSIKATLYDRITSPFTGTFILAWCIYNYKVTLPLLFGSNTQERVDAINQNLYVCTPTAECSLDIYSAFSYPFAITVVILVIVPFPAIAAYWASRKYQQTLTIIRSKLEDQSPPSQESYNELRRNLRLLTQQYESEFQKLKEAHQNEIEDIKSIQDIHSTSQLKTISDLESSIRKYEAEMDDLVQTSQSSDKKVRSLNDQLLVAKNAAEGYAEKLNKLSEELNTKNNEISTLRQQLAQANTIVEELRETSKTEKPKKSPGLTPMSTSVNLAVKSAQPKSSV